MHSIPPLPKNTEEQENSPFSQLETILGLGNKHTEKQLGNIN
jgi:hypothetical protein